MQACSILNVAHVGVRRVTLVIVHNGLNKVLKVGAVAQVVSHGVKVVRVRGEEGMEKRRGCLVRGLRRIRATQRETLIMDGVDEGDTLKRRLDPMWVTSNSVQACSDLAHVVLVLVGARRVTVVHNGLEGVLVVRLFCEAILFVNCSIRRCSL